MSQHANNAQTQTRGNMFINALEGDSPAAAATVSETWDVAGKSPKVRAAPAAGQMRGCKSYWAAVNTACVLC